LKWKPGDKTLENHLQVCNQILALDPTSRGLSSAERNRRGRLLLERTVHALEFCFAQTGNIPSESAQQLLESAREALATRPNQRAYSENTDAIFEMVENLWKQCEDQCRTSFDGDEVLSRVVERLSLKTVL